MVRTYERTSTRGTTYTVNDLNSAIDFVKLGKGGTLKASKLYGIPRSTLKDHIKGRRGKKSKTFGRPTILSQEDEESLARGIK